MKRAGSEVAGGTVGKRVPVEGKRLRLVPFGTAHVTENYLGWLNDRDLMRYSQQSHRRHTAESAHAYLSGFDWVNSFFWAIEARDGDAFFGTANAYVDSRDVANVGILLGDPAFRGRGYAGEAWGAVMAWLFTARSVAAVEGGTDSRNAPMLGIFRSQGMIPCGQTASDLAPGAIDCHFRIVREQWLLSDK